MPDRVRVFLLTVFVVDDLAALLVIAFVYSDAHQDGAAGRRRRRVRAARRDHRAAGCGSAVVYTTLGVVIWAALLKSGVDPVVAGLAIGLSASAYTPDRGDLEEATGAGPRCSASSPRRSSPARPRAGLTSTLSPNARLQTFFHPWTSYVIVPLFALANAGIVLDGGFLAHAYTAPVTLGILIGYVVGKPVAVIGDVLGWSPG